ncbi:MAG TPA: zinc-dependent metalloprotease, partial [Actinomycetota bacterium]|nr:zinc-dependent metalloprotease [Actinomycetota bacterium]
IRGFSRLIEPLAPRMLRDGAGMGAAIRRKALAAQVGVLLGYVGRKVLGQYDLFAEERDVLYFVGPNIVEVERRFRFSPRDFRLWLCLHEVTHRAQFDGVPWLRGYLTGHIASYVRTMDLDARQLAETVRRAIEEARRSDRWRGLGFLFLLMTEEQRELFRKMQALMSLLEGHANHVMARTSPGNVRGAERMRRTLQRRRRGRPLDRAVQRTLGFEAKVRQYDLGEAFCLRVEQLAGQEGLGRVWEGPENLPTLEEIGDPDAWVARVVR